MKVNILTPINRGGPYSWGRDLAAMLIKRGYAARHTHTFRELMTIPLSPNSDIVHASVPLAFRTWERPVVMTIHGDWRGEHNIWKFFYPRAVSKAGAITSSRYLAEKMNLPRAVVIPNAVFPENFKVVEHGAKERIRLVTVTNFYFEGKAAGVLDTLKALDSLSALTRNLISYSVIGGGPLLKRVSEEAKSFQVQIDFRGELADARPELESSDIFVYYSHYDNFPVAILEAMACGLPVVTNNVGATAEIIEHGVDGFVVGDYRGFAQFVEQLVNEQSLRATIGSSARRSVEMKFDWERVIDRYLEVYNSFGRNTSSR